MSATQKPARASCSRPNDHLTLKQIEIRTKLSTHSRSSEATKGLPQGHLDALEESATFLASPAARLA